MPLALGGWGCSARDEKPSLLPRLDTAGAGLPPGLLAFLEVGLGSAEASAVLGLAGQQLAFPTRDVPRWGASPWYVPDAGVAAAWETSLSLGLSFWVF